MPEEMGIVNKGGTVWLEMTADRNKKGLEIWVKAIHELEDFFKENGNGNNIHRISDYGGIWEGVNGDDPKVYPVNEELDAPNYCVATVGTPLREVSLKGGTGRVNLGFLRFVGISRPEGVRFVVLGKFRRSTAKDLMSAILLEARNLIRDYIAPVHVSFRISSQDV